MNIIWPYDPFSRDVKLDKMGREIILNYFFNDTIEAVYVASPSQIPKRLIQKQLAKLNLKNVKIKIIEFKFLSTTKMVNKLVNYAKETKVDIILLASNNKKTIPKFIFGSFAETCMHLSLTDVLVYHQKTICLNKKPKKILYAHDLTNKGNKGLLRAVTYAQKWQANLFVLHVPTPNIEISDEEFVFSMDQKLKTCEQLLQKMEIKYTIVNLLEDISIDDLYVDEIILNFAQKNKIDLIALTTQANNLKILLGGSITRQVLRKSKKPILVFKT